MADIKFIEGGVCAPKGFLAGGIHCGIRKNKIKKDLGLIFSQNICDAAAVYTQNLVKGAPIYVTQSNLRDGRAQAVIVNSGNANTCNADGKEKAEAMCKICADELGIAQQDVIVASTGVIGQVLNINPIKDGMKALVGSIKADGSNDCAEAILTTDTRDKQVAVSFFIEDKKCVIGGIAKGSGMIHPNMATMLCFLTSDVSIDGAVLAQVLAEVTADTFNMVSVDGDTSTNDMASLMANGMAENVKISSKDKSYEIFKAALYVAMEKLSKDIAGDGEGATKLLECVVTGAYDTQNAKKVAKSVITSSLFKSAMFGADANWGRVLCAIGYSGASIDIQKVGVKLGSAKGEITVCLNGAGVDFSEARAKEILSESVVNIFITLCDGTASATAWGCDLTYDYVKINGDYRT